MNILNIIIFVFILSTFSIAINNTEIIYSSIKNFHYETININENNIYIKIPYSELYANVYYTSPFYNTKKYFISGLKQTSITILNNNKHDKLLKISKHFNNWCDVDFIMGYNISKLDDFIKNIFVLKANNKYITKLQKTNSTYNILIKTSNKKNINVGIYSDMNCNSIIKDYGIIQDSTISVSELNTVYLCIKNKNFICEKSFYLLITINSIEKGTTKIMMKEIIFKMPLIILYYIMNFLLSLNF